MSKVCRTCGRAKHKGLCDMVELDNGRIVHTNRVEVGGDLHERITEGALKVKNRWLKKLDETKKEKESEHERTT